MFYSASQRRGVIFLLFVILLLCCYYLFKNNWDKPIEPLNIVDYNHKGFEKDGLEKDTVNLPNSSNPNNWSKEDWINLGFSKKQANVILNYKSKIKYFKNKKQLYNCYVFNSDKKIMLDSIVLFPEKSNSKKKTSDFILVLKTKKPNYNLINHFDTVYFYKSSSKVYSYFLKNIDYNVQLLRHSNWYREDLDSMKIIELDKQKLKALFKKEKVFKRKSFIDINKADSNQLITISGIGPKRASYIIKYRNKLGGYVRINQLKEVYSISDSLFLSIKNKFLISDSSVIKININICSIKDLIFHPYINWNLANAIVNYRQQHGQYMNKEKIKEIHLVNEQIYLKIAPYLKI